MRGCLVSMLILVIAYGPAGFGGNKGQKLLKAKGRIVKEGEDFTANITEGESLQVCFIPVEQDLSSPKNGYTAQVDQSTGYFIASGVDGKGLPQGEYRVKVELKKNSKDVLDGRFDAVKSPYVFDIDEKSEPMVVDIAKTASKS